MPLPVDIVDALMIALQGEREDLHTSLPGQVVKYYPDTQTADIQPMVKKPVFDEDDNRLDGESFPVLPAVPVAWPRAGGYIITMPLAKGDFVWVMFSETGTGEYRATGQESEPFDITRHALTYPVCVPGAAPDVKASTDADVVANAGMVMGYENGDCKITFTETNNISTRSVTKIMPGTSVEIEMKTDDPITSAPERITFGGGTDAPALAVAVDALCSVLTASYTPSGTETGLTALLAALASWKTAYFHGSTVASALIRTR